MGCILKDLAIAIVFRSFAVLPSSERSDFLVAFVTRILSAVNVKCVCC